MKIIKCKDNKRKLKRILKVSGCLPTFYGCCVDKNGNQIFNDTNADVYIERHLILPWHGEFISSHQLYGTKPTTEIMKKDEFIQWADDLKRHHDKTK